MRTTQQYLERRWTALILLCVAQFVVVLDASIVNVALPSIGKGLNFSEQNLPWVVNAYVIAFGGFLLLGGRAADLLGRRRVFMVGLVVVAVASLAAGFAVNQGQLIAARAAHRRRRSPTLYPADPVSFAAARSGPRPPAPRRPESRPRARQGRGPHMLPA